MGCVHSLCQATCGLPGVAVELGQAKCERHSESGDAPWASVLVRQRAAKLARDFALNYPHDVFPWPSDTSDGIAAQAMRHAAEQIAKAIEADE